MLEQPTLEMVNVSRVHGVGETRVLALTSVSLDVQAGEMVAVMGHSGSGKSTLLNLAGGLDRATSGIIRVNGRPLDPMSRAQLARLRRREVGYVFQDFNLIPSLTAAENIAFPQELDGVPIRAAFRSAHEALDAVGLRQVGDRFPDTLSGGEQQRIAIARAVAGRRSLVLADEPTGALDSQTGEQVLALLRSQRDAGKAVLLVTHDEGHALHADRVVLLKDGVKVGLQRCAIDATPGA